MSLPEGKRREANVVETPAPVADASSGASCGKISNPDRVIDPDGCTTKEQLTEAGLRPA